MSIDVTKGRSLLQHLHLYIQLTLRDDVSHLVTAMWQLAPHYFPLVVCKVSIQVEMKTSQQHCHC